MKKTATIKETLTKINHGLCNMTYYAGQNYDMVVGFHNWFAEKLIKDDCTFRRITRAQLEGWKQALRDVLKAAGITEQQWKEALGK